MIMPTSSTSLGRSTSDRSLPSQKVPLVKLSGRYFVIAVSTSKFVCHGQELMGISTMKPIYEAIEGARPGETVKFKGRNLLVEEVA